MCVWYSNEFLHISLVLPSQRYEHLAKWNFYWNCSCWLLLSLERCELCYWMFLHEFREHGNVHYSIVPCGCISTFFSVFVTIAVFVVGGGGVGLLDFHKNRKFSQTFPSLIAQVNRRNSWFTVHENQITLCFNEVVSILTHPMFENVNVCELNQVTPRIRDICKFCGTIVRWKCVERNVNCHSHICNANEFKPSMCTLPSMQWVYTICVALNVNARDKFHDYHAHHSNESSEPIHFNRILFALNSPRIAFGTNKT